MNGPINGRSPESVERWMRGTGEYEKTATVRARQMPEPFVVDTPEGQMEASAGDYLVSDIGLTHCWPVRKDVFESTYRKVGLGMAQAREYVRENF